MNKLYLITGATGHIGTILISELLKREASIRALVLPGDESELPPGIEIVVGDVTDEKSLTPFFDRTGYDALTLIHCAARITVASKPDPRVWHVNVDGTEAVMRLALQYKVERVLYISSVHAIPEKPEPQVITEVDAFSPEWVHGQYAKSKAAAAQLVLKYAQKGLNVSILHPSGIIGPGDKRQQNHMIRTLRAMAKGTIPVAFRGGYDFVDSRDVVAGILACEEKGRAGTCYILCGHYLTVLDILNETRQLTGKRPVRVVIPYMIVKWLAPAAERFLQIFHAGLPLLTPYSVYTLHTNGRFSHEKATKELGYSPRETTESIRDSLS